MTLPTSPYSFSLLLLVLILSSAFFLTTASESKAEDEYSYTEGSSTGPENWGNINPKWKVCGDGKSQSPIDFSDEKVQESLNLGELQKEYKPAHAVLKNRGHDIMIQWEGDAGELNINGTSYKLSQIHWHTPSEHTLHGSKFDLELHAVHQNSKGEIAVIGVWYQIGQADPLLSKLLKYIKSIGDDDIDLGEVNPADINFGRKYYRYVGSLTTPPCTEGVIWTVMNKVSTVSKEQHSALIAAVHHGFEKNARPTQELNGRQVWFYNPKEPQEEST
ncbi:alpha carbonic anhydrase 4-like [Gastrolobium bilobum]|uniref:alpha carbonic anhydrase 4-like n=1 Tax=Gastrolobium bilobum TaxID=150636 RepID=UPI002AB2CC7E|nr:alpha carbonic anhydrase 4-like [Gastrolobium bilobum]